MDRELGEATPAGQLWHRFTGDGYGEQADGSPRNVAWTHAQYVRLAWSITARRPVAQPKVVACRYIGDC